MFEQLTDSLKKIRLNRPVILNITNYVTMDFIANGLLSLGASPIMSHDGQEIKELLQISRAVVINLGTLDPIFIELCRKTCLFANELNIPIILDPVGAGASRLRTETAISLINDYEIAVIRGNGSEIQSLCESSIKTNGVDSSLSSADAVEAATQLSHIKNTTIVITGATDIILAGNKIQFYHYGSKLMSAITGMGCLLSAVIAAFQTVSIDRFTASEMAVLFYGLCGEKVALKTHFPGTFKTLFIDQLSQTPDAEVA